MHMQQALRGRNPPTSRAFGLIELSVVGTHIAKPLKEPSTMSCAENRVVSARATATRPQQVYKTGSLASLRACASCQRQSKDVQCIEKAQQNKP